MPNPLRILTFSQSKENETQGFCSLFADSAYTHTLNTLPKGSCLFWNSLAWCMRTQLSY